MGAWFHRATLSLRTARAMIVVISDYGIPGISRLFVPLLRGLLACSSLFLAFCLRLPGRTRRQKHLEPEEPKRVLLLYRMK